MATPVMMPNVGISVESCILTEWHKKKGDAVKKGDVLFTYETDKSTLEEESPVDGIMLEQFFKEDDDIPTMTNVCVIGEEGESTAEFAPKIEGDDAPAEASAEAPLLLLPQRPLPPFPPLPLLPLPVNLSKFLPAQRLLPKKTGIDPHFAAPTGPNGRIIERDVRTLIENGPTATYAAAGEFAGAAGTGLGGKFSVADIGAAPAAAAAAPAAAGPEYVDEKMPNIRKAIAKQMTSSLSTAAQLTHTTSFDATEIMAFRKKVKANGEKLGLANITLNDIILFAVSRCTRKARAQGS